MDAPVELDPVLLDDWHPIAASVATVPGVVRASRLLGQDLALWRSDDGVAHAWADRCPHRGMRFSKGRVAEDTLVCAYHGWRFAPSGACSGIPAHPTLIPPGNLSATTYRTVERYGMIWACLGRPTGDVLPFPEYHDPNLRTVLCGPYPVETSGPRIVENFLDMAHFPFVHGGILGEEPKNEVRDYRVSPFDDGTGAGTGGVIATGCFFWQPQTNSLAHGGSEVEYSYRVTRPLTAILTKVPEAQDGFHEAISLHIQPIDEERSVAWIILALTNFVQTEAELRGFQDTIFLQDLPIVENQVPKRLPLRPGAEASLSADALSVAYRRYLRECGLRFGTIPTIPTSP